MIVHLNVTAGAGTVAGLETSMGNPSDLLAFRFGRLGDGDSQAFTVTGIAEGSAMLTAAVADIRSDFDLPEGSTVTSVQLPVTVAPSSSVHLRLAFDPPSLTAVLGPDQIVELSLLDVPEGATVTVTIRPSGTPFASLSPRSVMFTAATPRHELNVTPGRVGSLTLTARADTLVGSDLPPGSTVALAELLWTVLPVTVDLQLQFDPSALTVAAGSEEQLTLSYSGFVPSGGAHSVMAVALSVSSRALAQVTPEAVEFDLGFRERHEVTVLGVAAGSVTLRARAADFIDLSEESVVTSAQLPLTVSRSQTPVDLQFAFDPEVLTVAAGSEATVEVSLAGVPAGYAVEALVHSSDETKLRSSPRSIVFTASPPSPVVTATVTLTGVAAGVAAVVVDSDLSDDDLPPDSSVAAGVVFVTVVPAPVHLQLAFELAELVGFDLIETQLTAGDERTLTLNLPDVPEGVEVPVTLSASGEAVRSSPRSITFTSATMSREVTLTGVAEGSVTLTASADENALADSGLPPDSTVAIAELAVEVEPAPVHLQLVFDPSTLTVVVDSEEIANLDLPGVPAGFVVPAELSVEGGAADSTGSRRFNLGIGGGGASIPIEGLSVGTATITVVADASPVEGDCGNLPPTVTCGLPPGSTVELARLPVMVVPPPVHLQLAFDPPTPTVVVGSEAQLIVQLLNVPAGADVQTVLSSSDEETVRVVSPDLAIGEVLSFNRDVAQESVTIAGVAAGRATLTASVDEAALAASGLPPNSTVERAQLPVTVLPGPVHLQLAFDSQLTVPAGHEAAATLRLPGVPAGATVLVDLNVGDESTASLRSDRVLLFDAATTSQEVRMMGVAEGDTTVTAVFGDFAGLHADSTVEPAELEVTVTPQAFHLGFSFNFFGVNFDRLVEGGTVQFGLTLGPSGGLRELGRVVVRVTLSVAGEAVRLQVSEVVLEVDGRTFKVSELVNLDTVAVGEAVVMASVDEEALANSGLPPGSTVTPAEFSVTILPPPPSRLFLQLAVEPAMLTGVAGATTTAVVSLELPAGAVGAVLQGRLSVAGEAVRVDPEEFVFRVDTAGTLFHEFTITFVAGGDATVFAQIYSSSGVDISVSSARLEVTVEPAPVHLQFAFDPSPLTVVAGSSETVTLRLEGLPASYTAELFVFEVNLRQNLELVRFGGDVLTANMGFSAQTSFNDTHLSRPVTIAGVAAGSETVTAEEGAIITLTLPPGSTVEPAELSVTVVPPPVDLQLAFDPSTLELTAGAVATALLHLPDVPEGAGMTVTLSSEDAAAALGLFSSDAGGSASALFSAAVPSREVTIFSGTEGRERVVLTAAADVPGASGLPPNSIVEEAELPVTVVPAPVRLALAFDPPTLEVAAGSTATATLNLPGMPEATTVTVTLTSADEETLRVASTSTLVFDADTPSRRVTVASLDDLNGARVTVTADFSEDSGLPPHSTVAPAELPVTVVPPPPVHLALAFDPPSLTVAVGGEMTAVLRLLGDVSAGVGVDADVLFDTTDGAMAEVLGAMVDQGVQFFSLVEVEGWSESVGVSGVAAGVTTLMAEANLDFSVGLPQDSTVAPAELVVTVVESPTAALRLAFEPPSLTVVTGAVATVVMSLSDMPVGVAVTVELRTADAETARLLVAASGQGMTEMGVPVTELRFTAAATSPVTTVTVTVAGVAEGSVTLTAEAVSLETSGLSADSSVTSAQLPVAVVPPPVHLALVFDPTTLTVAVGAEVRAFLLLPGLPEGAALRVDVREADIETAQVDSSIEVFFDGIPGAPGLPSVRGMDVTGVAVGNTTVTAIADLSFVDCLPSFPSVSCGLPPDSTVAPAELAVTVVPAPIHLQLAFDPPSLTIVAGSVEHVLLRLVGDVPADAVVSVFLENPDLTVARSSGQLSLNPLNMWSVNNFQVFGVTEGVTTITADLLNSDGLPPDSTVAPAELLLTVVPPPVHLALAFDPPTLTLVAGNAENLMLRLPDVPAGAEVQVDLSVADAATAELLSAALLVFDQSVPVAGFDVRGVAAGVTTLTASLVEGDLTEFGLPPDSTVAPAELPVTVIPAPVHLALAFAPPTLTVVAGDSKSVFLTLPDVPIGATLTVTISTSNASKAQVDPESVMFTSATTSREVTVTGVGTDAGSAVLTAEVEESDLAASGLPPDSTVALAQLAVTVKAAPFRFVLAFEPPTLTVVVGSSETVVWRFLSNIPNVMLGDLSPRVSLLDRNPEVAQVVQEEITGGMEGGSAGIFRLEDFEEGSREVRVRGVSLGDATIVNVCQDDCGPLRSLPSGSTLVSMELAVRVVPPPVHLALVFDPPVVTVAAGAVATVTLSLPGVPEGAAVTVALSAATTAQLTPRPVVFTAAATSPVTTATVTVLGVTVGNAIVTAVADTSGLPPNSTVAPADLEVTVIPAPIHLQLAFDPTSLTVVTGGVRTAVLSLSAVPAGASVAVTLGAGDELTAQLMTEPELRFTAMMPRHEVTVAGVAEGVATIMADAGVLTDFPEDSTVMPAELPVTVVPVPPMPVALQLAFEPPVLTVVTGATATAVLSLVGELPEGIEVAVTLSVADATTARVLSQLVRFAAQTPGPVAMATVTVLGQAAGVATLTASVDADALAASGLPEGSTVASAVLEVTVVLPTVHLQLAFDRPALTVAVGSGATAALSLPGLPEDAAVTVALSVADATARVVPREVIFTAQTSSPVVTATVTLTGVAEGMATLRGGAGVVYRLV